MKLFFKVTAIFEGLTGLALILVPQLLIRILFLSSLTEPGGIIIAKIAGAAIITIAFLCWFTEVSGSKLLLKLLLFYNITVVAITVNGIIHFVIKGIGAELIICFHTLLVLWSLLIFRKMN